MARSRLKAFSALTTAFSLALLLACTENPTNQILVRDESPSGAGKAIVLPVQGRGFATTVLGPGERMWIRQSQLSHARFVCSTGNPLQCERIGMRAYCQCHGIRKGH